MPRLLCVVNVIGIGTGHLNEFLEIWTMWLPQKATVAKSFLALYETYPASSPFPTRTMAIQLCSPLLTDTALMTSLIVMPRPTDGTGRRTKNRHYQLLRTTVTVQPELYLQDVIRRGCSIKSWRGGGSLTNQRLMQYI
ncbi:uncharacterized protein B0H18DRAFT_11847 [Fomitopsis serialis]|uniref:uncharacterized protein n=1 Tax=Fomitopsis serialis TaxID=139415 RepID=UPI00200731BE|nr:uncharacterized protein B0H18DRAFT_11847 [Neoantrodia serialis]KAH9938349.1 hypothetical protein B0H18DRAFT_11847 [Neoantrodia serialis]